MRRLVCQHRPTGKIADRKDVRHVGLHVFVHGDDAALVDSDAGSVGVEFVAIGAAADRDAIDEIMYSPLGALHGSVSAEHGIGLEKKAYLKYTRSEPEIELMRRTKRMMDPANILNPGKVFDL